MKTGRSPFAIARFVLIFVVVILCFVVVSLVFFRKKDVYQADKAEVGRFLNNFDTKMREGNADSLLSYFDESKKTKTIKQLLNFLAGKADINGMGKPASKITLDVYQSSIEIHDDGLITAKVPANFSFPHLYTTSPLITFGIAPVGPHKFKIIQLEFANFLANYKEYRKFEDSQKIPDSAFKPITLAAFKTARELRKTYDSVIWFAHTDNNTFYYVVKGKWNKEKDMGLNPGYYADSTKDIYKMGLVSADHKEIIPVEYDLIHNINGTFPGLIEVESDGKRGFYTISGKLVVPIKYDQIFPINDDSNLAVLKEADNYYYLKKDTSISERVDLKIDDFLPKIKYLQNQFDLYADAKAVVTEYNSRLENGTVYITPSYLVDLNMGERVLDFLNPLRDELAEDVHKQYEVKSAGKIDGGESWLQATFYSVRDYFLGGRSEFYGTKKILINDKKRDKVFGVDIRDYYTYEEDDEGGLEKVCDLNSIKVINDSLFELKSAATLAIQLYDPTKVIAGGPHYSYLSIKGNKLIVLPNKRNFGFTKYMKMDESYLSGCYNMLIGTGAYDTREKNTLYRLTNEMLRVMKNEIYADYRYKFKDQRWQTIFNEMAFYNYGRNETPNVNVDDSLTEIDKYNINWIDQKLKAGKAKMKSNNLAAR